MNKQEIIINLKKSTQSIINSVKDTDSDYFRKAQNGKWSICEQVDHLLRSIQPLNKALRIPLPGLRILFGKANIPTRDFEELHDLYLKALVDGAKAKGRYIPSKKGKVEILLKNYEKQSEALLKTINSWKESDLDQYCLPHPILGKLIIREMLYFTLFHTKQHGNRINEILLGKT